MGIKFCVAAISGVADPKDFGSLQIDFFNSFSVGAIGKVIEYFRKFGVKEIVFVGGLDRPDFKKLNLDGAGLVLMSKILASGALGDDALLSCVAKFFEKKGFKIISPNSIYLTNHESYRFQSSASPSYEDLKDIELGIKVCESLGSLDIGQSVVVKSGYVLGVEAAEGTDELLRRCAILRNNRYCADSGGILVKLVKKTQDRRLDLPTIGPETILLLGQLKYLGVAFSSVDSILLDPEKVIDYADQFKIFLHNIPFCL
jgi:DUF1009 family protein